MKTVHILLAAALFLLPWTARAQNAASAVFPGGSTVPVQQQPANQPVQRPEGSVNRRHASFNERAAQGGIDLVFFGDSITHGWEDTGKAVWDHYYGARHAVNFGISGDRTQHILWRIENGNLVGMRPKVVVLMIGTNNLNDNPLDEIVEGITKITEEFRSRLPESKLLLLAIFPREEHPGKLRAIAAQVNERIAKLDDGKHVFYLDIGAQFQQPDGSLPRELMPDSVHLSEKGYEIWARAIEPKLAALLGSPEVK